MIKKFKEFNEAAYPITIFEILSKEEVEDQFLRLEEVLGNKCRIARDSEYYFIVIEDIIGNIGRLDIYDPINDTVTYSPEVFKELTMIKNRIESMYPSLTMITYRVGEAYYLCVYIFKKEAMDDFLLRIQNGQVRT